MKILIMMFLALFFISGCSEDVSAEKTIRENKHFYPLKEMLKDITKRETVYLPVYSHVYTSEEKYEPMGITLSIRNTDSKENLLVEKILYYNTGGDLIETYVSSPHILEPMGSIDFVVDLQDMRGGSGANFIIKWAGTEKLSSPVIQAVMVNNAGNRAFAFITNGQKVE